MLRRDRGRTYLDTGIPYEVTNWKFLSAVSESVFFYSAYDADKSKRISKYTYAATKYFYISLILSTSAMCSGYAADIYKPIPI